MRHSRKFAIIGERLFCFQNPEQNQQHPDIQAIEKHVNALNESTNKQAANTPELSQQRVTNDINTLSRVLQALPNSSARDKSIADLRGELEVIVADFQKSTADGEQRFTELRQRVRATVYPLLLQGIRLHLESIPGITGIQVTLKEATFNFQEEPMRLTLQPRMHLQLLGQQQSVQLQEAPIPLQYLGRILPNLMSARTLITRFAQRQPPVLLARTLELFEYSNAGVYYVVTPREFLHVDGNWQAEMQRDIKNLTQQRDGLLEHMYKTTGGVDVRRQALEKYQRQLAQLLHIDSFDLPLNIQSLEKQQKNGQITEDGSKAIRHFIELRQASFQLRDILDQQIRVEAKLRTQQEIVQTGRHLVGLNAGGATTSIIDNGRGEWNYHGANGQLQQRYRYSSGSFNPITNETYSSREDFLPTGERMQTSLLQGVDRPNSIQHYDADNQLLRTSNYDSVTGQLLEDRYHLLGIREFIQNGRRQVEIDNPAYVLSVARDIRKRADGIELLTQAARMSPQTVFSLIGRLNRLNVPMTTVLCEAALAAATTPQLQAFQKQLATPSPENAFATEVQQTRIVSLLSRRIEQRRIAKILIRSDHGEEEEQFIQKFLADPALQNITDVLPDWIDWRIPALEAVVRAAANPEFVRLQVRAIITRNLFFRTLPVTRETVASELQRWLNTRESYASMHLFRDRNIVFLAHEERLEDMRIPSEGVERSLRISGDAHMAGRATLLKALRAQQGPKNRFSFIRPDSDRCTPIRFLSLVREENIPVEPIQKTMERSGLLARETITRDEALALLEQAGVPSRQWLRILSQMQLPPKEHVALLEQRKAEALQQIRTMPPPLTFFFDGHGGPDALYLSHGQIQGGVPQDRMGTIKITVRELADALRDRQQQFRDWYAANPRNNDILILNACYNANFIRGLYDELGDARKPIAIGQAEYGQVGFSSWFNPHGNPFISDVLGTRSATPSTLGTIMDNEFRDFSTVPGYQRNTNPSIYIPGNDNVPMQLTRDTDAVNEQAGQAT